MNNKITLYLLEVIYQTGESYSSLYLNTEKKGEITTRSGVFFMKFQVFE